MDGLADTHMELERVRRECAIGFSICRRFSLEKRAVLALFEALPDDAFLERITEDYQSGCWNMLITSMKFDRVPDGQRIPFVRTSFVKDNPTGVVKLTGFVKEDGITDFRMPS